MRFVPVRRIMALAAGSIALTAGGAFAANITQQDFPDSDSLITPAALPPGLAGAATTVMVKLTGASVAEQQGIAGRRFSPDEKHAAKQALKQQQDGVRGAIEAMGGTVEGTFQSSYNGIKVTISRDKLGQVAALPGVVAVKPLQVFEPNNVRSIPFIGAPAVWQSLGLHGEHVKVGIIDTGIDYTHANFGGPGTPAAYAAAHAAEALPADPALFGPNAPRVKGGIDLVGDSYNAATQPIPHPDPNPLDCNGHGSHVAGTAAGSGVKANGTTFTGPYNAATIGATSDWLVGPGVAPQADLYAIRVFGCTGATNVVVDAIEWAVDNDMDVINMSLGSPFGASDSPTAEAATNAARAGVVVVASAGNDGPNQYITGAPASANGAISVAANDSTASFPAATISTSLGTISAINANDFGLPATSTYTVKVLTGANVLGCSVAAFGGPLPPNTIAVVQRGVCARVAKAIFGQQAGAAAVIMVNNAPGLPPFEGPITSNPDDGKLFTVTIPFLGVAGAPAPDGARLAAVDGQPVTVTAAPPLLNPTFKQFASFTSGGPRLGDSVLKPDITAPGVSILSTLSGGGTAGTVLSGTSMAAPHVTGVAALTVQAHPGWKVEDIKAAIVGTGAPAGVANYRTSVGGTGLVQPVGSTATQVVAKPNGNDPFATSLSFGFAELSNDFKGSQSISLRNTGNTAATFNVAQARAAGRPHTLTIDRAQVTVPAHADAQVGVKLAVPAATAGSASGAGLSFQEVAGLVEFTPVGAADNNGVTLRVPYYLVPRANSQVSTSLGKLSGAPNPTTVATVLNKGGVIAGNADFYALGFEDPKNNTGVPPKDGQGVSNDVRAMGAQSFEFPSAAVPTRRLIVFAVNTWNRWSNASTNEFDVFVDVDGDGVDDYVIVGADQGAVQTGSFNGRMGSFVFSTRSAGASIAFLATAPTDSSVALLPVLSTQLCRAGEPCLSVTNPRLTYHVNSSSIFSNALEVVAGVGTFNAWTPAVTTGDFLTVAPGGSATATLTVNTAESALTPAAGVMVVTQDNKTGASQAQLLKLK